MSEVTGLKSYYPFRSESLKEEYIKFYKERAMKWPIPYVEKMVPTSYGETYVRVSGLENAPVLILMHGGGDNSSSWAPNVEAFSNNYRIYAIDLINAANMSRCTRTMNKVEEILTWMNEVLDKLEIKNKFSIIGMSYGAYLAARYALKNQERIEKAILIAPPNFVIPNTSSFILRVLLSLLPGRHFTERLFKWIFSDLEKTGGENGKKIIDLYIDNALLTRKCYSMQKFINPVVFTKEELCSFKMPICYMIGENDINYSGSEAIMKLKAINPNIWTEYFHNVGHDLTILCAADLNSRMIKFLKTQFQD
jgi:pimeloyl-ACP methyl ester carboxylesterase